MSEMDKKMIAAKQRDFTLHVALIMKQNEVSKTKALFVAWMEGETGLGTRLQPRDLRAISGGVAK